MIKLTYVNDGYATLSYFAPSGVRIARVVWRGIGSYCPAEIAFSPSKMIISERNSAGDLCEALLALGMIADFLHVITKGIPTRKEIEEAADEAAEELDVLIQIV